MPQTTAIDGTGPVLVWVVSDGTAGMRLQALALAESLQRARPGDRTRPAAPSH